MDTFPVFGPYEASHYLSLLGVMRWMLETRHINVNAKESPISSYSAMPLQGHWEVALHIMHYLKLRHNSRLVFDPSYPDKDLSNFGECDWTDFYEGAVEVITPGDPQPRGKEVDLCMFVDKQNRQSRTRFIIYMKCH